MTTQKFYRDTWAEIELRAVYQNVINMKKHLPPETALFAVVKANAYGHGDAETAKTAIKAGASYLATAFLDEALALRQKGITEPVLVLGASRPEDAGTAAENRITLTVFQPEWMVEAERFLEKTPLTFHLKCDTGMGRIGIRSREEMGQIEDIASRSQKFLLEGIYTHFATADELDTAYFEEQLQRFEEMLSWMKKNPKYVHAANSAALLRFPRAVFNAVRMGIAMYGLTPSLEMKACIPFSLQPAFSLKTKLVHVKKLHKGESVSYGAVFTAEEDCWIGTLPIGYADGWIRRLQGQEVIIDGIRVPIIGRICMDQCMVLLPKRYEIGAIVTLIGADGGQKVTADEIARKLETINYEVTCMMAARIPRVYLESGKQVHVVNQLL